MTKRPTRLSLERSVIRAAERWHKWLTIGATGADYRKYCAAFQALRHAVDRLAKSRRKS